MSDIDFSNLKVDERVLKLSDQAVGALQMALIKSLAEQSDIVEVLKAWELKETEHGLVVLNPPIAKFDEERSDA